jgi:hypothetical protein
VGGWGGDKKKKNKASSLLLTSKTTLDCLSEGREEWERIKASSPLLRRPLYSKFP